MEDRQGPDEMHCSSCGESIDSQANFCRYCGEPTRNHESRTASGVGDTGATPDNIRTGQAGQSQNTARSGAPPGDVTVGDETPTEEPRRPTRDESPLRAVGAAAGLGILGVVGLVIVSVLVLGVGTVAGLPGLVVLALGTILGQYLGFAGLGLGYLRRRGYTWDRVRSYLGVRKPTLRQLGVVVLGYVAIFALLIVVGGLVEVFLPEPAENEGAQTISGSDEPLVFVGAVLVMFLVVGPCEEFLYRGIVQNRLRERLPAIHSILIASAIFAVVHVVALAGSPTAMLVTVGLLFFPALVLGSVYEYTGNIFVPSLLHSIHNSIIVTFLFFAGDIEQSAEFISWLLGSLPL